MKARILSLITILVSLFNMAYAQSNNYVKVRSANNLLTSDKTVYDAESAPEEVSESTVFYDGLGRPVQSVGKQQSPLKKDVVSIHKYDDYGRESTQYLPFVSTSMDGEFKVSADYEIYDFYQNASRVEHTTKYYSQTEFETSPLSRVLKQGAPGDEWQLGQGHEIENAFEFNLANEVRHWTIDNSGSLPLVSSTAYYGVNELTVSKVIDEDEIESYVFANKAGQTILKKQQSGDKNASPKTFEYTYFVYDEKGNLAYVLPPQAVYDLDNGLNNTFDEDDAVFENYIYAYHYDRKNRVIEKKVPGADWVYSVYNKLGQLVLTQDGEMRNDQTWMFHKYDIYGRLIITGTFSEETNCPTCPTFPLTRQDAQNQVDGHNVFWETNSPASFATNYGYTRVSYPDYGYQNYLTINYFDSYDLDRDGNDDQTPSASGVTNKIKGLPTAITEKVLFDPNSGYNGPLYLTTYTFYDEKMRELQTYADNHKWHTSGSTTYKGGDVVTNTYYNNGLLETSVRVNTIYDGSAVPITTTIGSRYEYDQMGRKKKYFHYVNNIANEELLATYNYNELGQLIEKNLHVDKNDISQRAQSVDYCYNVRGWLKQINNPDVVKECDNFAVPEQTIDCNELTNLESELRTVYISALTALTFETWVKQNPPQPTYTVDLEDSEGNIVTFTGGATGLLIDLFNFSNFNISTLTIGGSIVQINYPNTHAILSDLNNSIWPEDPCAWLQQEYGAGPYTPEQIDAWLDHALSQNGELNAYERGVVKSKMFSKITYGNSNAVTCDNCDSDDMDDLFGMKLRYEEGFTEINSGAVGLYAGNVSGVEWKSASPSTPPPPGTPAISQYKWGFAFKYDAENQILASWSGENISNSWTNLGFISSSYTYDQMGNIITLTRNGNYGGSFQIDDLTYSYVGNQLTAVTENCLTAHKNKGFSEASTSSSQEYTYNNSGRLVEDLNESITNIDYNLFGLTQTVTKSGNSLYFVYSSTGSKLQKINSGLVRDYIRGLEYQSGVLDLIGTDEGRANINSEYEYFLMDHLGNTRVTFKILNGTYSVDDDYLQVNNYYPFGLGIDSDGLYSSFVSGQNNYLFNGKEQQYELGLFWDDFGARMNNPRIARFMTMDPMQEVYMSQSSYVYGANSPLQFIELNGESPEGFWTRVGQKINNLVHGNGWQTNEDILRREYNLASQDIMFALMIENQKDVGTNRYMSITQLKQEQQRLLYQIEEYRQFMPDYQGTFKPYEHSVAENVFIGAKKVEYYQSFLLPGGPMLNGGIMETLNSLYGTATGTSLEGGILNAAEKREAYNMTLGLVTSFAAGNAPSTAYKVSKPLTVQAQELVALNNGKNSVTLGTVRHQIRFDLAGKAHAGVATPHMQIYKKNFHNGVQKNISRANKLAYPMTQAEIRAIRKYLSKQH